jgi:hypothetical protein
MYARLLRSGARLATILASFARPKSTQPKKTTTFEEWLTSGQRIDIATLSTADLDGWRKTF